MIIFELRGDIFKCQAQTLVCPVNTVGVMGNGLARAFRDRFEGLYEAFQEACADGTFTTRGFFLYEFSEERKILCFPTKRHWKNDSKLEWIDKGLARIVKDYERLGITSLAVPALGCGKGNLEWPPVRALIYDHLDPIDLKIGLFPP